MDAHSFHQLGAEHAHVTWNREREPLLEVEPGALVELEVVDASGGQLDRTSRADALAAFDMTKVNPVTGPVFVKGAEPGDALDVEIVELRPGDWGWTALIPGFGLLADQFPDPWLQISEVDAGRREVRFGDAVLPFEPFPGTIGVAPPDPGDHPVLVPTRWGGNLDVKHLRPGTHLLLPVGVEGALLSIGDTHAAMGDGEVCGTAVESPMTIAVRIGLRKGADLPAPQFTIPSGELARTEAGGQHVCTGVAPDLFQAAREATQAAIDLLARTRAIDPAEAYALASVACDLRIHQLVDAPNWTVGCVVPEALLR